jgi:hypothetical protein
MQRRTRVQKKKNKGKSGTGGKMAITYPTMSAAITSRQAENWMPIFPVKCTRTLRYSTTFQLTCTSGATATYVFRANDLFDPDYTSTGHQPMGFDQMMLSYNHFCVTHSTIRVTARNKSNTSPVTVCVRQDASPTPVTVIDRIMEFGGLMALELDTFGTQTNMLQLNLDVAKVQGISPSALTSDSTLRGDAGNSPTEVTYWHVQCWDTAALTSIVNYDVILEQTAIFFEPRDLTESLRTQVRGIAKTPDDKTAFVVIPPRCECKH